MINISFASFIYRTTTFKLEVAEIWQNLGHVSEWKFCIFLNCVKLILKPYSTVITNFGIFNKKQAAKVIWRKPHRIRGENRDLYLKQCFSGLCESPSQAGPRSVQPRLHSEVAYRQTDRPRTSLATGLVRISCKGCGGDKLTVNVARLRFSVVSPFLFTLRSQTPSCRRWVPSYLKSNLATTDTVWVMFQLWEVTRLVNNVKSSSVSSIVLLLLSMPPVFSLLLQLTPSVSSAKFYKKRSVTNRIGKTMFFESMPVSSSNIVLLLLYVHGGRILHTLFAFFLSVHVLRISGVFDNALHYKCIPAARATI